MGNKGFIVGEIDAGARKVPLVATRLSSRDILGRWMVRWTFRRMDYAVNPGLYAVGDPKRESIVLVTANYKLSFDSLRRELGGIDAWILVLDTKGVNVWCAAGKGTFGSFELGRRIEEVGLGEIVNHRELILPQLGAPGVSAYKVGKATGFKVLWGPVRARDIPAYLANKGNKDMRLVRFDLGDRIAIAPAELAQAWPFILASVAIAGLIALPFGSGYLARGLGPAIILFGSVLVGTLVFPALLPYLPFKPFSVKGAVLGLAWALLSGLIAIQLGQSLATTISLGLIALPIVSYLSMNFTGASTFTCQPGATLEVKRSIVPILASAIIGLGLGVISRVFSI